MLSVRLYLLGLNIAVYPNWVWTGYSHVQFERMCRGQKQKLSGMDLGFHYLGKETNSPFERKYLCDYRCSSAHFQVPHIRFGRGAKVPTRGCNQRCLTCNKSGNPIILVSHHFSFLHWCALHKFEGLGNYSALRTLSSRQPGVWSIVCHWHSILGHI